jgi:hypothetical protein
MKSKKNEVVSLIQKKDENDANRELEKPLSPTIERIIFSCLILAIFFLLVLLPPFFRDFFGIEVPWYVIILIWITGIPFKIVLRELMEPIFLRKFRDKIRSKFRTLRAS